MKTGSLILRLCKKHNSTVVKVFQPLISLILGFIVRQWPHTHTIHTRSDQIRSISTKCLTSNTSTGTDEHLLLSTSTTWQCKTLHEFKNATNKLDLKGWQTNRSEDVFGWPYGSSTLKMVTVSSEAPAYTSSVQQHVRVYTTIKTQMKSILTSKYSFHQMVHVAKKFLPKSKVLKVGWKTALLM